MPLSSFPRLPQDYIALRHHTLPLYIYIYTGSTADEPQRWSPSSFLLPHPLPLCRRDISLPPPHPCNLQQHFHDDMRPGHVAQI